MRHDIDPVLVTEADTTLLYANSRAERLFGPSILQAGSKIDVHLKECCPTFSLKARSALPSEVRNLRAEELHRFVDAAGRTSWITIETSKFERRGTSTGGICLRIRDKTTLRSTERESVARHRLLQAISTSMGEGLVVHDESGSIRFVNEEFARLGGSTVAAIENGRIDIGEILAPLLDGAPQSKIHPLLSNEEIASNQRVKCDLTLKDGRIFEIETFPVDTTVEYIGRAWRLNDVTLARRESQKMVEAQKLEGLGLLAGGIASLLHLFALTLRRLHAQLEAATNRAIG